MAGSAIVRRLELTDCKIVSAVRGKLDLCDAEQTLDFLRTHRPQGIVFAAARVGGIAANDAAPVEFLADNVRMSVNLLDAAYQSGVKRLLYLGSTCIYPRDCRQPIREEELLCGPLEKTNEAYSLAKITGVKLCQYYRRQYGVMFHSAMPTNLYGPRDNYDPEKSHVVAALIRKFHDAKTSGAEQVTIWGSGKPRREFLHVDDLADAVVHLLSVDDPPDWVNVGTGVDLSVMELAEKIAGVVGFSGRISTDPTRPDGAPAKRTDVTRLHGLGWQHQIDLDDGLARTYQTFLSESSRGALRS